MHTDPVMEWRRLADHYRSLSDEELRRLALEFGDLTESAQQALRSELQSRGLGGPETIAQATMNPAPARVPAAARELPPDLEDVVADDNSTDSDHDGEPRDYTWKVLLCDCDEAIQAWQLGQALTRAGVDNWPEYAHRSGQRYSRIFVAADQLDEARMVANQPIPADIVADSNEEPDEYVPPVCPGCGAADPVLESAEPVNAWHCEVCGCDWTEGAADADLGTDSGANSAEKGAKSASGGQTESFFGR